MKRALIQGLLAAACAIVPASAFAQPSRYEYENKEDLESEYKPGFKNENDYNLGTYRSSDDYSNGTDWYVETEDMSGSANVQQSGFGVGVGVDGSYVGGGVGGGYGRGYGGYYGRTVGTIVHIVTTLHTEIITVLTTTDHTTIPILTIHCYYYDW